MQSCQAIGPEIAKEDTNLRNAIPVEKRVAASLCRLVTGECYRSVAIKFGLGASSAHIMTLEFVNAVARHQHEYIKLLVTEDETKEAIAKFA